MKAYWDTSALLEVLLNRPAARTAFESVHERFCRTHTLEEVFAQITGGRLGFRATQADAAKAVAALASKMDVVSLSASDTLMAFVQAQKHAVRGGAIYDWLHVVCAEKNSVDHIYSYDSDLARMTKLSVVSP